MSVGKGNWKVVYWSEFTADFQVMYFDTRGQAYGFYNNLRDTTEIYEPTQVNSEIQNHISVAAEVL